MDKVIDVELDGDSVKLLYANGSLKTVTIAAVENVGELVQRLQFAVGATRLMLATHEGLSKLEEFSVTATIAAAELTLKKVGE